MAEPTEAEQIEIRLRLLKRRILEQEATLTELWVEMLDLRARRAVLKHLSEEENGDAE